MGGILIFIGIVIGFGAVGIGIDYFIRRWSRK